MEDYKNELSQWISLSARYSPKKGDLEFIKNILENKQSRHISSIDELKNPQFLEELLDQDVIVQTVLESTQSLTISLELYFYIITRRALLNEGIDNRPLADYIASILLRKTRTGAAFNNELNQGKTFFYLTDYLTKIALSSDEEAFYLRVRLGNQTLYLTGLFENHLRARTERRAAPTLEFFEQVGEAQYSQIKSHPLADALSLKDVFGTLGNSFTNVRKALNHMSERLINLGDPFLGND